MEKKSLRFIIINIPSTELKDLMFKESYAFEIDKCFQMFTL